MFSSVCSRRLATLGNGKALQMASPMSAVGCFGVQGWDGRRYRQHKLTANGQRRKDRFNFLREQKKKKMQYFRYPDIKLPLEYRVPPAFVEDVHLRRNLWDAHKEVERIRAGQREYLDEKGRGLREEQDRKRFLLDMAAIREHPMFREFARILFYQNMRSNWEDFEEEKKLSKDVFSEWSEGDGGLSEDVKKAMIDILESEDGNSDASDKEHVKKPMNDALEAEGAKIDDSYKEPAYGLTQATLTHLRTSDKFQTVTADMEDLQKEIVKELNVTLPEDVEVPKKGTFNDFLHFSAWVYASAGVNPVEAAAHVEEKLLHNDEEQVLSPRPRMKQPPPMRRAFDV